MKLAKEIFDDILTDLMDRRGIKTQFQLVRDDGPTEIWDELIATNESIIAAKLEPVKEALEKALTRLYRTISGSQSVAAKSCCDALALLSEEE